MNFKQNKKALFTIIFISSFFKINAQLKSPTEYFGYELGSKFHRHHQMVDYLNYLVQNNTTTSKLIDYGSTNEGRKLFVVVVSSKENMQNLDEIRQNNMKSIGLLDGNPTNKKAAITWLSYNVHGNEAVSMEASMEVLFKLLSNKNGEFNKQLSNSVIIIDPCINPDGRDRYANWYNQKVGFLPNANLLATEHIEPWPTGRPNHYLFDLNRDWAWLVQDESKQRIALYNNWMPHLHADFHEQNIESPYYFAPAAKPYHEELTDWQRAFQQKIGQYNKKEFDEKGWLYFSNERFDLLYPSYGDTYPTFNGAIGMTYEQGGIRAGLAVAKADGDTLTLKQRISHHVATSFAAINAVSDNANQVIAEFEKYFNKAKTNPEGSYQSYIIKSKNAENKIAEFTKHLDLLGIKYGQAGKAAALSGYSYSDKKIKQFSVEPNDLVLSMSQPKSKFLKVLMEPQTIVEDSATYDITAWSLPYAYGLNTFSVKDKLAPKPLEIKKIQNVSSAKNNTYAYFINWDSFTSTKILIELFNRNIKVRQNETPIEIDGKTYNRGALIITKTSNEKFGDKLKDIIFEVANKYNMPVGESATGMATKGFDLGSDKISVIKKPNIAILSGEPTDANAFGEIWHYFDKQISYPTTIITAEFLNSNNFSKFDVIILPRGNYARTIGDFNLRGIQDWIRAGGKLIAMESANNAFADKNGFELKKKESKKDTIFNNTTYENREREEISEETPGSIYEVTMDTSHPLAFGYENIYNSLVLNVAEFNLLKTGWNVGKIKENALVAGFVGKNAKDKFNNTLAFGVENIGKGKIVYMIHNPLFRGFWQNGKILFANAVFGMN